MVLKLKYPWPFPNMKKPHLLFTIRSSMVVPLVGTFSKILLSWCNHIEAHNLDTLRRAVSHRPKDVPLVTVSNHYSCIDDPALWGLLRWRDLWSAKTMRWSPAAHDIAFTRAIYNWFFSAGKCVPIIRGLGVYQEAMDFCIDRLSEGQWVHIFPEGKVNMTLERMRFKWGVGRLIYDCPCNPLVIPFYHVGMDAVLPNTRPYIPRWRKKVTILVGEPLDFSSLVEEMRARNEDMTKARKIITDMIQNEMGKLRDIAEELHYGKSEEKQSTTAL